MPDVLAGEVNLPRLLYVRRDGWHRLRLDLHAGRHRRRVLLREMERHCYWGRIVRRGFGGHHPPHSVLAGLGPNGLEEHLQVAVDYVRAIAAVFHAV